MAKIRTTELPEPRRLTASERAVLNRLVAHAACPELVAQATSAQVVAKCDCGCGSVGLRTNGTALSRTTMMRLSTTGRDDWFSIQATSTAPEVQVVVHVVAGLLHELEVFAGEGVRVDVPRPEALDHFTLF